MGLKTAYGRSFSIGYTDNMNPMKIKASEHMHSWHELLLIVRGNVSYCIDGFRFKVNPYDLMFIPANTYHFLIPEDESVYENFVISIDDDFIAKEKLDKLFVPPYKINIRKDEAMRELFERYKSFDKIFDSDDADFMAKNTIEQILVYSLYKPKEGKLSDKNTVGLISQYIAENIEKPLDSKIIAEKFNFTSSYIQNLFSKEMGIGIKHYINKKKIFAAHREIQNGLLASEAADKYGYQNYSSFYRQYIRTFGISPKKK